MEITGIQSTAAASITMNIPKIQSVIPQEGHFLVVHFSNGERKKYDINQLTEREMFLPLKNPAFFRHVSVEPGGHAVSWNSEIDISEYELWQNGEEIP